MQFDPRSAPGQIVFCKVNALYQMPEIFQIYLQVEELLTTNLSQLCVSPVVGFWSLFRIG